MTYVAILETHVGIRPHRKIAVHVPPGQSLDFDEGPGATRMWLRPHLGRQFHLVEFVELITTSKPTDQN